jgi:tape measure domain-containing protein
MAIVKYNISTKFTGVDRMSATINRMRSKVKGFRKTIDSTQAKTSKMLTGIGDRFITRGLAMGGVAVGVLGKKAINTASSLEAMKTAISFASGGPKKAASNLSFLKDTVNDLKVNYMVTAESFKRFTGAMMSTDLPLKRQQSMFKKLSTVTRVLGMNGGQTERVFYALGEMFNKGSVMSQELKVQLGNSLPGAVRMFADSINKTVPEMMSLMQKGALWAEKYAPKFVDYVYENYKEGLPRAMKTMNAAITDMGNQWTFTLEAIGLAMNKAGILEMLSEYLIGIRTWVEANKELISSGFTKFLDKVKNVFSWIYNNWGAIVTGLKIWITAWAGLKIINAGLIVMQSALMAAELSLGAMALALAPGAAIIVGLGIIAAGGLKIYDNWQLVSGGIDNARKELEKYKYKLDDITGANKPLSKEEWEKKYKSENPNNSNAMKSGQALAKMEGVISAFTTDWLGNFVTKAMTGSYEYGVIKRNAYGESQLQKYAMVGGYKKYLKEFEKKQGIPPPQKSGSVGQTTQKSLLDISRDYYNQEHPSTPSTTPYNSDATRQQQPFKAEINIVTEKGTTATVGETNGAENVVLSTN